MIQQPILERLLLGGLFAAEHAGEQAGGGLQHREGGKLAAGQDIVADGDLVPLHALADAFV